MTTAIIKTPEPTCICSHDKADHKRRKQCQLCECAEYIELCPVCRHSTESHDGRDGRCTRIKFDTQQPCGCTQYPPEES